MLPTLLGLPPKAQFEDVVRKVNQLVQELTNVLLNLDSLNVVSLTADHIDTGTLQAALVTIRANLTGGAYIRIDGNGMTINDGTKDTFVVDINGRAYFKGDIITDADAIIGNNLSMGESSYLGSKKITWSTDTGISAELEVLSGDVALRADGFVTLTIGSAMGLLVNKKITAPSLHASNGLTGTWYAATSSAGSPTVALSFVDGILVSAV